MCIGDVSLDLIVEQVPFRIVYPSPFVEVSDHVDDMYPEHSERFVRCRFVVMDYGRPRPIYCEIVSVYAACEIDILGIHEEPLIEDSGVH